MPKAGTATKVCNRCHQEKALTEFYVDKSRPDGLLYRCIPCQKAYTSSQESLARRRQYAKSPTGRKQHRKWEMRDRYGITPADWEAQLIAQGGRCASCGDPFIGDKFRIDVDHCHRTGRFRGLLCSPCNTSEGLLKGDPERVRGLLEYVIQYC